MQLINQCLGRIYTLRKSVKFYLDFGIKVKFSSFFFYFVFVNMFYKNVF